MMTPITNSMHQRVSSADLETPRKSCRCISAAHVGPINVREWWIVLACFLILVGTSPAQDAMDPLPAKPAVENGQTADAQDPEVPPVVAEKRKKASAGFAAVAGIAILGIGAIAFTMIWARRLRRLARDPGPAQKTVGNDFWFLKPPKAMTADSKRDVRPVTPPEMPE